jgi:hypothetical protein
MSGDLATAVEALATAVKRWDLTRHGPTCEAAADELLKSAREVVRASEELAMDGDHLLAMVPYGLFLPTRWIETHVPERLDNQMLQRLAEELPTRLKFATEIRQAALSLRGGGRRR